MLGKKAAITAAILLALALFARCGELSPAREAAGKTGGMRVRVVDGYTDKPIEGAEVVVPETGARYHTDARGKTPKLNLPVIRDSEYDLLLENEQGRATLIVFAEGYTPYLLLYARVTPQKEREGPTVRLFPDDGTLPVFTVIEAPPPEWAEELVDKYR